MGVRVPTLSRIELRSRFRLTETVNDCSQASGGKLQELHPNKGSPGIK